MNAFNRCDNEGDTHVVYITPNNKDFPPIDQPTSELLGDDNIIPLSDIDTSITSGELYKWRVDCVEGITDKRRPGDTWLFAMHD